MSFIFAFSVVGAVALHTCALGTELNAKELCQARDCAVSDGTKTHSFIQKQMSSSKIHVKDEEGKPKNHIESWQDAFTVVQRGWQTPWKSLFCPDFFQTECGLTDAQLAAQSTWEDLKESMVHCCNSTPGGAPQLSYPEEGCRAFAAVIFHGHTGPVGSGNAHVCDELTKAAEVDKLHLADECAQNENSSEYCHLFRTQPPQPVEEGSGFCPGFFRDTCGLSNGELAEKKTWEDLLDAAMDCCNSTNKVGSHRMETCVIGLPTAFHGHHGAVGEGSAVLCSELKLAAAVDLSHFQDECEMDASFDTRCSEILAAK